MNTTAYTDQLHAATRDANAALDRMGQPEPIDITQRPWLAAQVAAYHLRAITGTLHRCPHLGTSPQVAHTAVWAPHHLVCPACVNHLRPATLAADSTCDRCHHHTPIIHAAAIALGPVLLAFGLCPTCLDADTPHQKENHR